MFCPNCGRKHDSDAVFCPNCGRKLNSNVESPKNLNPQNTPSAQPMPVRYAARNDAPKRSSLDKKALFSNVARYASYFAVIIGMIALFIGLFGVEGMIKIKISGEDAASSMTFKEYLSLLVSGNRIFFPTAGSIIIGVSEYTLIFGSILFLIIAGINICIRKNSLALNIFSAVMSILTSISLLFIIPVSRNVVPDFDQAFAISAGVLIDDLDGIFLIKLILFSALLLILSVASMILAIVVKKRGMKK